MQDGTYPSRNFATLGPSELQPPFTAVYIQCANILFLLNSTGQVSDPIHNINILQSPVFLINSRSPRFYILSIKKKFSLSRSYRVILPSSFSIIYSTLLCITHLAICVDLGYGYSFFSRLIIFLLFFKKYFRNIDQCY